MLFFSFLESFNLDVVGSRMLLYIYFFVKSNEKVSLREFSEILFFENLSKFVCNGSSSSDKVKVKFNKLSLIIAFGFFYKVFFKKLNLLIVYSAKDIVFYLIV